MTDTPKRFCKDCRHLQFGGFGVWQCLSERALDPVHGEVLVPKDPWTKNANLNCEEFEASPMEAPRPPAPRRPWWKFWGRDPNVSPGNKLNCILPEPKP